MSPSTKTGNVQCLNKWNTNRNQIVVSVKAETHTQTYNLYNKIDDTNQTDQQRSQHQNQNTPPSEGVQKGIGLHPT